MKPNYFIFLVLLLSLSFGCKKEVPAPVAQFSYQGNDEPAPCEVTFVNSSTNADTYQWNFGDGATSTEQSTNHIFNKGGNYSVMLIAKGKGGADTMIQSISIPYPLPNADFTFSLSNNGYAPCNVSFTNLSTNSNTYQWNFGDGSSSSEKNPTHLYQHGGTYTVILNVTGDGGSQSKSAQVTILSPPPVAMFSYTGGNCNAPCQVSFNNLSDNADSYYWDFGDGGSSSISNPTHTYYAAGTYTVTLTANGDGGSDSYSKSVVIKQESTYTDVTFYNTTFTDIVITFNNSTKTIYVDGSVTFYSVPGSSVYLYAYTSGETTSGTQVGSLIEWSSYIDLYGGTDSRNLVITDEYFFLYLRNNGTHDLSPIYVNPDIYYETVDYIILPNNNMKYRLGYYRAFTDTQVRAYYDDDPYSYTYWYNIDFPWTENQSVELVNQFKSKTGKGSTPVMKNKKAQELYVAEVKSKSSWDKSIKSINCK